MHASGGVFAPARRALTTGILLSVTAMACEGMAVSTALPSVAVDLGGLETYGFAFSAFMLVSLIGAIAAGRAADRGDPLSPARWGFASFAAGLLVAGLAPTWPIFLLGRAVQGFGAGSLIAVAYVVVARGYPENLRPRLMALLSSAWILPALIGPAIAGQVAEHASWRLVFVGILPPVALGAAMLLPRLGRLSTGRTEPDASLLHPIDGAEGPKPLASLQTAVIAPPARSEGHNAKRPTATPANAAASLTDTPNRLVAAVRLTLGLALVLLAPSVNAVLTAVVLATVGILLALPALVRLLPRGAIVGRSGLPAAVALRGLLACGFFGAEALIPLGLATDRGVPPSLVGLSLTAGALAWVAGSWGQDRAETAAAGSVAQRALRAAGGLLFIVGGIGGAAAVIVNPTLPLELVVAAWAIAGLGMGVAYPAATLTALGNASSGEEGAAAASLQVAETIGTAVGTGAVGALFALAPQLQRPIADGLTWGFLLATVAAVVAVVPALRLAPTISWQLRWRTKST
jgi:MFS family permease